MARKLIHWYTGISEFEVLLDRRDHSYHSQGAILHDIGRSLVSSLNHTAVAELKYDPLYDKVVAALEKPCYPQTMSTYSVQSGRSTAVLLSEIDNRIRVYRRRLSRQRAAGAHRGGYMAGGTAAVGAGVAQSSHALGTDQKTGTASAQNSPLDLADHIGNFFYVFRLVVNYIYLYLYCAN